MLMDHVYFRGTFGAPKSERIRPEMRGAFPQRDSDPLCAAFFSELFRLTALDRNAYRDHSLQRRVPACLRFLKVDDLHAAREKLLRDPRLASPLLNVFLLGVTEFYRDKSVFEQLRERVLPVLRGTNRRLRIWSAACSDGPELVSVATLLADAGLLEGSEFLGSDCREDAIRRAQAGIYSKQMAVGLAASSSDYWISNGSKVQVAPRLMESLRWTVSNLLQGPEPGPWDLILWRNMAIYLRPEVAESIWNSLICELQPGGFLVCGTADQLPNHRDLVKISPSIYQKRPESTK